MSNKESSKKQGKSEEADVKSRKGIKITEDQKSFLKGKATELTGRLAKKIAEERDFVLIPFVAKIVYIVKDAKIDLSLTILGKSIASTSIDSMNPAAALQGGIPGTAKAKITLKLEDRSLKYLADIEYKFPPVVGQWKTSNTSGTMFQYGKEENTGQGKPEKE